MNDHAHRAGRNGPAVPVAAALAVTLGLTLTAFGPYPAPSSVPQAAGTVAGAGAPAGDVDTDDLDDPEALDDLPKTDDPVELGDLEVTVTEVDRGLSEVGEYLTLTARGEFVIVYLTVENTGSDAAEFWEMSQQLYGLHKDKLREFDAEFGAAIYLEDAEEAGSINPGLTTDTALIFDVPVGTEVLALGMYEDVLPTGGPDIAIDLREAE